MTNIPYALKRRAENGDTAACMEVFWLYYGAADYQPAFKWALQAAQRNDVEAAYWVGVMYQKGFGVAQNHSQALLWYQKAAEQGDEASAKRVKELENNEQQTPVGRTKADTPLPLAHNGQQVTWEDELLEHSGLAGVKDGITSSLKRVADPASSLVSEFRVKTDKSPVFTGSSGGGKTTTDHRETGLRPETGGLAQSLATKTDGSAWLDHYLGETVINGEQTVSRVMGDDPLSPKVAATNRREGPRDNEH